MIPTPLTCQKSNLYLNQHATRLAAPPASFLVHYWGGKPRHLGNDMHSHSFLEICYVADGEGIYINNGITYPLKRGTLYCSKPGSQHQIQSDDGMLLLFVAFDILHGESAPDIVRMFETITKYHHLFIPDAEETAPVLIWKSILIQASEVKAPYPEVISQLAHSMLITALSLFAERSSYSSLDTAEDQVPLSGSLQKAKDYIQTHLSGKLAIKDVADAVHVSERQLSRLLSTELQQTFPAWVRTERLKRASYLLAYTDMSMEDIARETGFETVHYFHRVFTDTLHSTPGKFRKSIASKELDTKLINDFMGTLVKPHQKT
ncbi:helix-turn-helix domain-containing protein [Paenibacillus sp. NPDC056579]|uniref:helix-turn-helix domain-containing protein n=1 Tax=Paenibacillus sp. NPDC056579 TaxID=3345871 RepID=UPI003695F79A